MEPLAILVIVIFAIAIWAQAPSKRAAKEALEESTRLGERGEWGESNAHAAKGCAHSIIAGIIGLLMLGALFSLAPFIPPR